jgi:hypothetical protein
MSLLVLSTSASCQQKRGSKPAVTFPHLLHEAENLLPSLSDVVVVSVANLLGKACLFRAHGIFVSR